MKTILWAALTANGNYAQSSPGHPPKVEALADFAAQTKAAGNFIVGRRTFEGMPAIGGSARGDVDIVVLSRSAKDIPGVTCVTTPQEALAYLRSKGHTTALLAAGADLHNAFLSQGLVDSRGLQPAASHAVATAVVRRVWLQPRVPAVVMPLF